MLKKFKGFEYKRTENECYVNVYNSGYLVARIDPDCYNVKINNWDITSFDINDLADLRELMVKIETGEIEV